MDGSQAQLHSPAGSSPANSIKEMEHGADAAADPAHDLKRGTVRDGRHSGSSSSSSSVHSSFCSTEYGQDSVGDGREGRGLGVMLPQLQQSNGGMIPGAPMSAFALTPSMTWL